MAEKKKTTSSKKSTKSTKKSTSKKSTKAKSKTKAKSSPKKKTTKSKAASKKKIEIVESTEVDVQEPQKDEPKETSGVTIEVKHWLDEDAPGQDQSDENTKVIETPATKIEISEPAGTQSEPEPEIELPDPETDPEHEWHKFEEESEDVEPPEWDEESYVKPIEPDQAKTDEEIVDELVAEQSSSEVEETDEERPEWDNESYAETDETAQPEEVVSETKPEVPDNESQTLESDIEEHEEPEWDKEKWQHAAIEEIEEEAERPEWDEEKYKSKEKSGSKLAVLWGASKSKVKKWWNNPKARNTSLAGASVFLLLLSFIPATRYAIFNTTGLRATATVAIVDSETKLPLRNVEVELASQVKTTNETGNVVFDDIKYGDHELLVRKTAYQEHTQNIEIGSSNNMIDAIELIPIGARFNFRVTDWLTDSPLVRAEVSYGENSAFTDENGLAILTVPSDSPTNIETTVTSAGYHDLVLDLSTTSTIENSAPLVIDRTHYFVSKRNGTFDVYASDADGNNQRLVLSGTGEENPDIRFDVSPDGSQAVLVATRDKSVTNSDGFVLSGFYQVDLDDGSIEKLDESERVDIVGWIDNTVVYVKIQAGASGRNPERHRLVTHNLETNTTTELAASNYFNDVLVAAGFVFYAPSDAYKQDPKAYLFRSNADGTSVRTVLERNVWTVLRTGYDEIVFDSQQTWYQGMISEIKNSELTSRPSDVASRLYADSPDESMSAWVDIRDGKGALIILDVESGEETTLWSQGGLRNPIVWLSDDHIVFRVVNDTETADYVIGLDGGEPRKISDVTNVSGADRWYYYY